ncbi:uncharacterized protein A1O9_06478 [Exophiala aquamarina CBS 119918]|uniref:Mitochondrial genome maintenance protein Mgr2 n=1 Tax=Exophiala aquamarina CBS 119918 TaxID=1182545 RepID=A0A072PFK5_9EURO|nr:uncharacterized protein A1O9_06478 [Exophiala aquamarina CBS 119918]KEF58552.1 hypothetical protein A1O9_06478 [Exophiala aquamarina CBS 119918]
MPPMPPSAQRRGPHWTDKLKMGMLMGGTVGGIMGLIYGVVTVFQYGGGQAGIMRTLGKYMVGSGATFRYDPDVVLQSCVFTLTPNAASLWASAVSFEQTLLRWQLQCGLARDTLRAFILDEIDRKSANDVPLAPSVHNMPGLEKSIHNHELSDILETIM